MLGINAESRAVNTDRAHQAFWLEGLPERQTAFHESHIASQKHLLIILRPARTSPTLLNLRNVDLSAAFEVDLSLHARVLGI